MYQRRLSTIILVVLLVLVLVFPSIGDAIRGFVAYLVGEKGERIVSVLAGLFTILAVLFGPEIRQMIRGAEHGNSAVQSTSQPVSHKSVTTPQTQSGQRSPTRTLVLASVMRRDR